MSIPTALSRKVVGKSARENAERYCGCSSKKFERMEREAMDQGRIQDFFKEGVVSMRVQGKHPRAKGMG